MKLLKAQILVASCRALTWPPLMPSRGLTALSVSLPLLLMCCPQKRIAPLGLVKYPVLRIRFSAPSESYRRLPAVTALVRPLKLRRPQCAAAPGKIPVYQMYHFNLRRPPASRLRAQCPSKKSPYVSRHVLSLCLTALPPSC